jgi:hypothetical protein
MARKFSPPGNKPSTGFTSERVVLAPDSGEVQKADQEYRVGPGRPPKQYRWQKGQSGNPAGMKRRKSTMVLDLKDLLNKALNEPVTLRSGKREVTATKAAAGIAKLVTQFAEGDRHARRDLIALAPKLGIDLAAGQGSAIGAAVAALMSASDEAIITDFLRRHGVARPPENSAGDRSDQTAKDGTPKPEQEK